MVFLVPSSETLRAFALLRPPRTVRNCDEHRGLCILELGFLENPVPPIVVFLVPSQDGYVLLDQELGKTI